MNISSYISARTYSSVVIDEPPSAGNYGWVLKAALILAPFYHGGVSFVWVAAAGVALELSLRSGQRITACFYCVETVSVRSFYVSLHGRHPSLKNEQFERVQRTIWWVKYPFHCPCQSAVVSFITVLNKCREKFLNICHYCWFCVKTTHVAT